MKNSCLGALYLEGNATGRVRKSGKLTSVSNTYKRRRNGEDGQESCAELSRQPLNGPMYPVLISLDLGPAVINSLLLNKAIAALNPE